MPLSETAQKNYTRMFGDFPPPLADSDPEFTRLFLDFALDEVPSQTKLDDRTHFLTVLAALMGCQGLDCFQAMAPAALRSGLSPVELKELVYQGTAYLGLGRVLPFLKAVNEALTAAGVPLPLEEQGTTDPDSRLEAGNQAQVDIFGTHMRGFQNSGPQESRHIHRFGDYYTRGGLDYRDRELITFCFLAAQGGCEPQLTSHAAANLRLGNDKPLLIRAISQCLPYIGYPRSLNALTCINQAATK